MDLEVRIMIKKYLTPLIGFIFGGIIGLIACDYAFHLTNTDSLFLFVGYLVLLFCLMLMIYCVEIVIHESGHLFFGLISGYDFLSFRIFKWILIKENQHYQIKNYSLLSTAGQCLMAPPDYEEGKFPCVLYNLGGILFDGMSFIFFLIFYFHTQGLVQFICLTFVFVAFVSVLTNGIPISNQTMVNDGYNVLYLNKDVYAKKSFWLQMDLYEKLLEGKSLRDLDPAYFELPNIELLHNCLSLTLVVLRCNYLMEKHDFDEAYKLIKKALDLNLIGIHHYLLQLDLIYIEILKGNLKQAMTYKTKELDNFIKQMKKNPSVLRFQYVYTLKCEQNLYKAKHYLEMFDHLKQTYPYQVELKIEEEYMNLIKEMEWNNENISIS